MNGKTVSLVILRYGYRITEKKDYTAFYSAVLSARKKDRAGYPGQIVHNDLVAQLQAMWGPKFDAKLGDWQRWATELARIPAHELNAKMREGPPAALSHFFVPHPSSAEQAAQLVHEESAIALTFMKQVMTKVEALEKRVDEVFSRAERCRYDVKSLADVIRMHMAVARAYRTTSQDASPLRPSRAGSRPEEIVLMLDQSDDEHQEEDDVRLGGDANGGHNEEDDGNDGNWRDGA